LVARGTNELLTNQYFLGQLGYIRELVKVPPLLGSNVEFIGLYEGGRLINSPSVQIRRTSRWMARLALS
jgi:NTE family protein